MAKAAPTSVGAGAFERSRSAFYDLTHVQGYPRLSPTWRRWPEGQRLAYLDITFGIEELPAFFRRFFTGEDVEAARNIPGETLAAMCAAICEPEPRFHGWTYPQLVEIYEGRTNDTLRERLSAELDVPFPNRYTSSSVANRYFDRAYPLFKAGEHTLGSGEEWWRRLRRKQVGSVEIPAERDPDDISRKP